MLIESKAFAEQTLLSVVERTAIIRDVIKKARELHPSFEILNGAAHPVVA